MNDLIKLIEKAQSHVCRAKELAQKLRTDPEYQMPRDEHDIVHAINVLAMSNADVIDVTIDFMGNLNRFYVRVFNKTEYIPSYRGEVAMGSEDALKTLLSIESQLTELIIEAREEAEAKAEVEA